METAVESGQFAGETRGVTSKNVQGSGSSVASLSLKKMMDPSEFLDFLSKEWFGDIPTYNTAPPGHNPPVVSTLDSCQQMVEFAALIKSLFGIMADLPRGLVVEDFIGNTLFGQVYRGKIKQQQGSDNVQEANVMVKAWNYVGLELEFPPKPSSLFWRRCARGRFQDEMKLLTTASPLSSHDNMVKLIGSCLVNGRLAVVYELDPLDTLRNLLPRDDFWWFSRIKVAIQFASLVEAFHSQQLKLRNICAENVVLDQDFHVKLVDFSMLIGGDFGDIPPRGKGPPEKVWGRLGYEDPYFLGTGKFLDKSDVFSFGILLLELVTKRTAVTQEEYTVFLHDWAKSEFDRRIKLHKVLPRRRKRDESFNKKHKYPSLVHESFTGSSWFDANDGVEITKLALRCVGLDPDSRPTIKEVVKCMRRLKVAERMIL